MATYLKNNAILFSLMFLLFVSSSNAAQGADIGAICSKAMNPSFCLSFLKSIPKFPPSVDLPTLARILVDRAQTNAAGNLKQIQSLVQKATDPSMKQSYTSCSETFENAIGDFDEAKQYLADGDAATVNIRISAAMDEVDTCLQELKNVNADPSIVKKGEDLENVSGVILVISNMLPRK